jgi:hypothetical protein
VSKKCIAILCLFVCLFCSLKLQSQTEQKDKQPLVQVLKSLEDKFNISFSYADKTIEDKFVAQPDDIISLNDIIKTLNIQTGLHFEFLDDRFIVINTTGNISSSEAFKIQFLKEVILNKYIASGLFRNNSGIVTIKPEKFDILPGLIEPDILQTIQSLPGILSVDETVSNINVRGGSHDQNLILWEGIKMYQSGHFFGLISAYNPYLTKEVNVSKNGTSAQYGDGVSSVIDMQLSNTITNEFKGGAGFNLVHADVFVKAPITKNTELQISARRAITDLVNAPTYEQYFKRIFQDSDFESNQEDQNNTISKDETFYFYDVSGKFLYDISKKDKLRLSFLTIYNNLNYQEQSTINDIDESLNSKLIQGNVAGGIAYSRDWSATFSTTGQFYISNYNLDATNYDILNDQRLIQENEVLDTAFKIDAQWIINHNIQLFSGYQFSEVGISNLEDVNNPVFRRYIKEVTRTHAIFAETQFLSNNLNTNIKGGIRLNYISQFDTYLFEPRLSFSQRFANDFKVEFLGEFKSQTTSQIIDLQNDFLGIEKRRWVLSNDTTIPIIRSKQASIGVHYNRNNFLISAEVFYKYVDGITTRSQGFQNQFQFTKAIGAYEVKGLDFLINKQFDKFNTWLSYSFSKNDYNFDALNDGNPFPNNTDITHVITFANTYALNKLKFALGVNWHSGKPFTKPEENNPVLNGAINYSLPNSSNLKDYIRVDLSATHDFKISKGTHAEIGASIWNLFNTENIINTYYSLDSNDNISKVENQSLGITPNVSFRLNF